MVFVQIWGEVKLFDGVSYYHLILQQIYVQSIDLNSDVRRFEVPMNDLLETEVVLSVEYHVDYLLSFFLRENAPLINDFLQVIVAVLKE